MAKKNKTPEGFNSPFHKSLKALAAAKPAEQKKPAPKLQPKPPDDAESFAHAMHGVRPISKKTARVEPLKRKETALPDDDQLALFELQALVNGEGDFRLDEAEEVTWGMAPGANFALLERLKEGAFAFRRHLDLHGLTADEGHQALIEFILTARREAERCVLVVTGRGKGSPLGISVLKESLPRWLSRLPLASHVIAFCTAKPKDGGPGAYYVLLRRPGVRPFGHTT